MDLQFALMLLAALAVAPGDSLEIRYVGNAGFELYDGATTLLIDLPYESGAYSLMTYDPNTIRARGKVVSVITHRHVDHFSPGLFAARNWAIHAPAEVTNSLPPDQVLNGNQPTIGEFTVQRFATPHRDTEHFSYLVSWRGRRLYFVGDTEDPTHMLSMRDLDILFITPWLTCSSQAAGGTVDAHRVVLYHQFPDKRLTVCGSPEIVAQGQSWSITAPTR